MSKINCPYCNESYETNKSWIDCSQCGNGFKARSSVSYFCETCLHKQAVERAVAE